MGFEWDEAKRRRDLREHNVDFIDMIPLFDGDVDIKERIDRRFDYGETRIRCLGEIEGQVCVVIYTWRSDNRRSISARRPMSDSKEALIRVTLEETRATKDETDDAWLDATTDEDIARADTKSRYEKMADTTRGRALPAGPGVPARPGLTQCAALRSPGAVATAAACAASPCGSGTSSR